MPFHRLKKVFRLVLCFSFFLKINFRKGLFFLEKTYTCKKKEYSMKKTIEFDQRGYLYPYSLIELDLADFQNHFVDIFPKSETRQKIFANFMDYIHDFQREIIPSFKIWIDGSYTTKKLNPNDIDFVVFIPHDIYAKYELLILEKYKTKGAAKFFSVDAYSIIVFPENDSNFVLTQYDTVYWRSWFSKTARNRNNQCFEKGFIEINFNI